MYHVDSEFSDYLITGLYQKQRITGSFIFIGLLSIFQLHTITNGKFDIPNS